VLSSRFSIFPLTSHQRESWKISNQQPHNQLKDHGQRGISISLSPNSRNSIDNLPEQSHRPLPRASRPPHRALTPPSRYPYHRSRKPLHPPSYHTCHGIRAIHGPIIRKLGIRSRANKHPIQSSKAQYGEKWRARSWWVIYCIGCDDRQIAYIGDEHGNSYPKSRTRWRVAYVGNNNSTCWHRKHNGKSTWVSQVIHPPRWWNRREKESRSHDSITVRQSPASRTHRK